MAEPPAPVLSEAEPTRFGARRERPPAPPPAKARVELPVEPHPAIKDLVKLYPFQPVRNERGQLVNIVRRRRCSVPAVGTAARPTPASRR